MSKTVTIPTDGMNPFVVISNGVKYVYTPGETVTVPDGVALEIEEYKRWRDKYYGITPAPFGAKPDLSQNDPNAPDFVKNRTHYEGFATIIEEREVRAWFGGTGVAVSRIPQVGEKLTVTFNGETYKCVAWGSDGHVGLGNDGAYGIKEGENVPFLAEFEGGDEGTVAFIQTVTIGENTISIVDDSGNILLEGTFNVEMNVDEPCFSPDIPLDQPLIVGNTYKVVYDGVPYECVAWEDEGNICLGNGEIDGYEHSEDVPFMIGTYYPDDARVWYLAFYGSDSHIVSVSGNIIRKLDEKYLPDRVMDGIENAWTKAETAQNAADNVAKHYAINPVVRFTSDGNKTYTALLSGSSEVVAIGDIIYPAVAPGANDTCFGQLYVNDVWVGVVVGTDDLTTESTYAFERFKLKVLDNVLIVECQPKELMGVTIRALRVITNSSFRGGIRSMKLVFTNSDVTLNDSVIDPFVIYSTVG